jgi:hypothetical protein
MLAIHDQFTYQLRTRLQTTGMGLGLVRLLQDARRFEEARTTLYSLENGFQGVAEEADQESQNPCETNRRRQSVDRLRPLAISGFVGVQSFEPMTC